MARTGAEGKPSWLSQLRTRNSGRVVLSEAWAGHDGASQQKLTKAVAAAELQNGRDPGAIRERIGLILLGGALRHK